jgi:hypothetical protein
MNDKEAAILLLPLFATGAKDSRMADRASRIRSATRLNSSNTPAISFLLARSISGANLSIRLPFVPGRFLATHRALAAAARNTNFAAESGPRSQGPNRMNNRANEDHPQMTLMGASRFGLQASQEISKQQRGASPRLQRSFTGMPITSERSASTIRQASG